VFDLWLNSIVLFMSHFRFRIHCMGVGFNFYATANSFTIAVDSIRFLLSVELITYITYT